MDEIEEIVRPCGLGRSKARDISACMKILWEEYGGKCSGRFRASFKAAGVGRKSANLIMGDVFGKPAIVTDTHCIRLVNRMGLVDQIKEPKKVEMELWKIIPPKKEAISVTGWFIMEEKSAQPGPSHSATGAGLADICRKIGV